MSAFWILLGSHNKRTESPDNDSAFCDNISSNSGNGSNGCTNSSATKFSSQTGDQHFPGHINGILLINNHIWKIFSLLNCCKTGYGKTFLGWNM